MKISRRVVGNDGSIRKEEKVLTINVKPGNSFCSFSILLSLLMKFLKMCSVMRDNIFILVLNELGTSLLLVRIPRTQLGTSSIPDWLKIRPQDIFWTLQKIHFKSFRSVSNCKIYWKKKKPQICVSQTFNFEITNLSKMRLTVFKLTSHWI